MYLEIADAQNDAALEVMVMPIDTAALKMKMSSKGITVSDLAKILDIDESTYYRRMSNNGDTFTVEEVQKIVEALRMSRRDATAIFLP